jgi:hypothetical protein
VKLKNANLAKHEGVPVLTDEEDEVMPRFTSKHIFSIWGASRFVKLSYCTSKRNI